MGLPKNAVKKAFGQKYKKRHQGKYYKENHKQVINENLQNKSFDEKEQKNVYLTNEDMSKSINEMQKEIKETLASPLKNLNPEKENLHIKNEIQEKENIEII